MRVLYALGARPNFVKMAPVVARLRARLPDAEHVVVHTGQHYDRMMSDVFLDELGLPEPDHVLEVGSGSHAVQTARVMERVEPVLVDTSPDLVIVPGDVNSTLAVTLVAAKLGIALAHLEAGLRSYDRSMPEEVNRIVADRFADLLFIHSREAQDNLLAEGIDPDRIRFVGNTMIDSLVAMEPRFRRRGAAERLGLARGEYLLVTLHRPALVDGPRLPEVLARLRALPMPVVFPAHPRTLKMLRGADSGVRMIGPQGYLDFLSLLADARAVLTDSGGVQEESTYLGVRCFTLRDNTERPVTIGEGTNTLLGLDPARIDDIPGMIGAGGGVRRGPPEGWDGHAAERVAAIVHGELMAHRTGSGVAGLRSPWAHAA